ncbi:MAG: pilus assembly PilX N-terminal domain-containing protein [Candidatus Omnitrophota bacterium]
MSENRPKGAALYLVIGTLIIVLILARVILAIILNQATISRHHTTRIQAYYAAQAGMNYALEQLRTGAWYYNDAVDNSCPNATSGCDIDESTFPPSILPFSGADKQFKVVFCPGGIKCPPSDKVCVPPAGYSFCINISVLYTAPTIPS